MSRPKVPEDQKRNEHVILAFTAAQMKSVRICAAHCNMDARDWALRLVLEAVEAATELRASGELSAAGEE